MKNGQGWSQHGSMMALFLCWPPLWSHWPWQCHLPPIMVLTPLSPLLSSDKRILSWRWWDRTEGDGWSWTCWLHTHGWHWQLGQAVSPGELGMLATLFSQYPVLLNRVVSIQIWDLTLPYASSAQNGEDTDRYGKYPWWVLGLLITITQIHHDSHLK